jgi:hypothetical protein
MAIPVAGTNSRPSFSGCQRPSVTFEVSNSNQTESAEDVDSGSPSRSP